jgi:hypothetical protein
MLLQEIPTKDHRLSEAIEYVRGIPLKHPYIDNVLDEMRAMRSDLAAGLLDAAKAEGTSIEIAEFLLREALYEVRHLGFPYDGPEEIDHIEKLILRAARTGFGEDSPQYSEVYSLYRKRAIIAVGGTSKSIRSSSLRRWDSIRDRYINSLTIMIDDLRLKKVAEGSDSEANAEHKTDIEHLTKRLDRYHDIFFIGVSVSSALICFALLRLADLYLHPNKLGLDVTVSVFVGLVMLIIFRPKWRSFLGSVVIANVLFVLLQLLAGTP